MVHLLHYESSHSFISLHLIGMYVYYEYIYYCEILLGNDLISSITPQTVVFRHHAIRSLHFLVIVNEVLLVNSL